MIRPLIFAAFAALSPAAAFAGDPIIQFEAEDPEMNAAIGSALSSMDAFLSHVRDSQGNAANGALVKVALETSYGHENIWVDQFTIASGGGMTGKLANEPNDLPGKHFGDTVEFDRSSLRDWSVFLDGKLYGNFTTRVLIPHLDADSRAQLEQVLSATPVPQDW